MRRAARSGGLAGLAAVLLVCAGCDAAAVRPDPVAGADTGRGRRAIERVGCGACHVIPGVAWPRGRVGPSLDGFASQSLIAGRFPNTPEMLARWVRDAPALAPGTGMPTMPLTEEEARDIAAYLHAF